jgi:hypothetical protein
MGMLKQTSLAQPSDRCKHGLADAGHDFSQHSDFDHNLRLKLAAGGSGDFNRDGHTDLVWRNYSTGGNVIWHMQGTTHLGAGYSLPQSQT